MVIFQNMGEAVNNLLEYENRQAWNGMEKVALRATEMMQALENTAEVVAHQQLQDMSNNAITDPDKFHSLGLRTKTSNVGENIGINLAKLGLTKGQVNFHPLPAIVIKKKICLKFELIIGI